MSPISQLFLAANLAAFLAYGWDKWRAARGGRRIPEVWLLGLAFLGLVGAWCGVWLLRHKTRKRSFLWKLFFVTGVELVLVGLYLSRSRVLE